VITIPASLDAAGRPGAKSHEEFMIELFGHVPE